MNLELVLGSFILFGAAMLQGLSGFGFSLLALPFLTLLLPPIIVVPLLVIFSLLVNSVNFISVMRFLDIKRIWFLLVGGLTGIPLGAYFLKHIDQKFLTLGISAAVIFFCLILIIGYRKKIGNPLALFPVGIISGIFCAGISLSGPPVIIFLASRKVTKNYFRANLAFYFLILNIVTVFVYLNNRMVSPEIITRCLMYLPALVLGLILGNIFAWKISEILFRKIILSILLITGLTSLLINIL